MALKAVMTSVKDKQSVNADTIVNSFTLMPELQKQFPRPSQRWILIWRLRYRYKSFYRWLRTRKWLTRVAGAQYKRSRDMIEIDITYLCNLSCLNCNRSVPRAPDTFHMPIQMVREFVDESLQKKKHWRRIRILGGEPTLHPEFQQIIEELLRYQRTFSTSIVEVVTNGYGTRVKRTLASLPSSIVVDNSEKSGSIQPHFGAFNMAPVDDPLYARADFSNGCSILQECGMGLTPMGYYPCAVAGGIDRILKENIGLNKLPNDQDDMLTQVDSLCKYCGRFQDGHFIPGILKAELTEELISPTWHRLYENWKPTKRDAPSK